MKSHINLKFMNCNSKNIINTYQKNIKYCMKDTDEEEILYFYK